MIYILILILILALLSTYIIFHIRKLKYARKTYKRINIFLVLILLIMSFILSKTLIKTMVFILLGIVLCFLITDILNCIFKFILKGENLKRIWKDIYNSSVLTIILGIIFIPVGYITSVNVVNTNYIIHSNKSFGSSDLNISMISDLHLGTTMDVDMLEKYCNQIENTNPDLVVLVGDIFDENTTKESMESASKLLGNINSKYGVYYVYGNHDTAKYALNSEFNMEDVQESLSSNNVVILDDETKNINDEFYIVGREDISISYNNRKSISELTSDLNKDKFILVLDHQPLDFAECAENKVDLQLSGHTHNGQIWPFGVFIDIFKTADLTYGHKAIGDYNAIVSSGIGGWGYPIKIGTKAEIVNIKVEFNK